MLAEFFLAVRGAGLPVSLPEYLTLLSALKAGVADYNVDRFYFLARSAMIKDEALLDRFDEVFSAWYQGMRVRLGEEARDLPEDWLRRRMERLLSDEEKALVESMGGWEALMEALKDRLDTQDERHEGGNKWIGTAGTSPFGAYGYNPEGVRIGQHESRHRRAVKVWDRREFRNLDDRLAVGNRNLQMALRGLRRLAREGAPEELDLDSTIGATARNAGLLDLRMRPERRNAAKVLLFIDVGGSMEDHVRVCEELFTAARAEFKHLEHYYFHNCVYESVWRDSRRRRAVRTPTMEVINTYGPDYRLVLVGDATMSPWEISHPGASVEHWNDVAGAVWMKRLLARWRRAVWLNPVPEAYWEDTSSIALLRELMTDRMFPLTVEGLNGAVASLQKGPGR